jgi:hypothetical protein
MNIENIKTILGHRLSPEVLQRIKNMIQTFQVSVDVLIDYFLCFRLLPFKLCQIRNYARLTKKSSKEDSRRVFDYNISLIPNKYIASIEKKTINLNDAKNETGLSMGYPAWNLIYYSLVCGIRKRDEEIVVIEIGTNKGMTSIVLAQALLDAKVKGKVYTVDMDPLIVEQARMNIRWAGLENMIETCIGDSINFLEKKVKELPRIDFAFLDGDHSYKFIKKEFAIIYPKIIVGKGLVYFDNTCLFSVRRALRSIQRIYGGNIIVFDNCSWGPPGNGIWQARGF